MAKYPGTLLPRLTDPKDSRESRKAVLDLLKKINDTNSTFDSDVETLTDATSYSIANGRNFKNAIINGDFQIWQRGTSFATAADGAYSADRFRYNKVGVGVVTLSQSTDTPESPSLWSLKVDVTTVDTSIAAGDFQVINQFIEGYDVRKYIGKTFTLSFYVKSPKAGIHCVRFSNSGADRSYVSEYTVNAPNTWEKKTITVDGGLITAGTWYWTNGAGLCVTWCLMAGTTFQTSPNAWQTGNFLATANQVNCFDSTSNDFYLSQVQLELGEVATEFERRPIGVELELCQWYYKKSYDLTVAPGTATGSGRAFFEGDGRAQRPWMYVHFGRMRATANVVVYSFSTGASAQIRNESTGADIAATAVAAFNNGFAVRPTAATPGAGDLLSIHWTADADF